MYGGVIYCLQILIGLVLNLDLLNLELEDEVIKWFIYTCPLFRAGDFIIGCCLGAIYVKAIHVFEAKIYTILELLVLLGGIFLHYLFLSNYDFGGFIYFKLNMLYTPFSAVFVYVYAINRGKISVFLSKHKLLLWLGDISGYTFLIHHLIIRYFDAQMLLKCWVYTPLIMFLKLMITFGMTILFTLVYLKLEMVFKKEVLNR